MRKFTEVSDEKYKDRPKSRFVNFFRKEAGFYQHELEDKMFITHPNFANKMNRDCWTTEELAKAAELAGYKLAFIHEKTKTILYFDEELL